MVRRTRWREKARKRKKERETVRWPSRGKDKRWREKKNREEGGGGSHGNPPPFTWLPHSVYATFDIKSLLLLDLLA